MNTDEHRWERKEEAGSKKDPQTLRVFLKTVFYFTAVQNNFPGDAYCSNDGTLRA
jgi:hypothetical protein